MRSTPELREELFRFLAEMLAEKTGSIPESGAFPKVVLRGAVKDTECHSLLSVETADREDERCVTIGAYREGDDRLVSNVLFCGGLREIRPWLRSPEGQRQIAEAYGHLEEQLLNREDQY